MSNKLRLEVVLAAVDKMTRPLKEAMAGSKGLAATVKATREQLSALNKTHLKLDEFDKLRRQAAESTKSIKAAKQALSDYTVKLEFSSNKKADLMARMRMANKDYDKQSLIVQALGNNANGAHIIKLQQLKENLIKLEKEKAKAINSHRKLQQEMRDEGSKLKQLTDYRRQLAGSLRENREAMRHEGMQTHRLANHQDELKTRIAATNAVLKTQEAELAKVGRRQQQLVAAKARYARQLETRDRIAGGGASTMAAGAVIGAPVVKMVRDYSSFEDAMLGVAKQVDGARDGNGRLTKTYYEMGDAIKAMAEKIPMATNDIAALVEGGARMGIQGKSDLLEFARVAALASTAFDLPADQLAEDMGKIANVYKIPIKDIQKLGDTINYLDDNAQSKGADIINVMQRIAGSVGSMDYKEAAALGSTFLSLGASPEIAATATKAMVRELQIAEKQPARFRKGLKELGLDAKKVQAAMAKDSTGTIMKVMEAVNKLPKTKQMGVMVDLFGKEYGDDAAKLADNLGEYRKQLELVRGEKAKGSMKREGDAKNETLSAQWQMLQNKLFNQSSGLGSTLKQPLMEIMQTAGSVIGKFTAWTKANPELTATLIKVATVIAVMLAALGSFALALAGILGPLAVARFGLGMIGPLLSMAAGGFGKLWAVIRFGGTVLAFIARLLIANPIVAIAAVIAAAAYAIWRNWDTLGPMFAGLWERIKAAFASGWEWVKSSTSAAMQWFFNLPARFMELGSQIMQGMVRGIDSGLAKVKDAITGAGEATITWFKEKLGIHSPSRVFAQLGGFTMAGLQQGITGGQDGPLSAVLGVAKRLTAAGAGIALSMAGPAMANQLDQRGPMRATPPAAAIAAPAPITITIHAAPGMDEKALAQAVAREIARQQNQQAANRRSRWGDSD